jgi:WD40 repeat protein
MSLQPIPCPYIGLRPYTEAQQEYFFGRDRDVRSICSNLYAAPLTILYGASGVGKSSVLLAGVVPRLRSTPRTAVVMFREWQGPSFLQTLKLECIKAVESANKGPLHLDADLPIDKLLAAASQALGGALLILFDQFEEYSLYHPEDPGNSFDGELARAVNRPETQAHFLIALREDGLSKLDRFRTRIPNLLANRLRLQHLDRRAAEEAIRKPLDVYNNQLAESKPAVKIEDDLVEAVLDQIGASQIGLSEQAGLGSAEDRGVKRIEAALLQMVMTRLWKEEQEHQSAVLRRATLDRLEGAKQIVKRHLDEEMEKLSQEERGIASRMFRLLVTSSGSKIAQETDVLASIAECSLDCAKGVLAKLTASRILNRISDSERYEIFHDVLGPAIREWQTAWQLAEGEKRAAKEAAEQATEAERKNEEQRSSRRRMILTVGLSVMLGVMATLAGVAGISWRKAERETHGAHALRLAAIAGAKLPTEPQLALVLAQAAVAETYPKEVLPEAELALRQAVRVMSPGIPSSRTLTGHSKPVYELTFSGNGKRLATASLDNMVKVWDLSADREPQTIYETKGRRVRLAFNADGTRLAIAEDGPSPKIWDLSSGQELNARSIRTVGLGEFSFGSDISNLVVDSPRGKVNVRDKSTGRTLIAFPIASYTANLVASSPDGKLLAAAGDDGAIRIWDTTSKNEISKLSGYGSRVLRASFSTDGSRLAALSLERIVTVWNIQSRQQLYRSSVLPAGASALALSSNGARMAIGGSTGQVTIVTVQSDEQAAALSPDGRYVVLAGKDGTLNVLNRISGEVLLSMTGPPVRIWAAAVSPDGKRLAVSSTAPSTASSSDPAYLVKVLEVSSGRDLGSLRPFACPVQAVAFNADGTSLTTACKKQLNTWNIASGQELGSGLNVSSQNDEVIALSSDGTRFAGVSSEGKVTIRGIPSDDELGPGPSIDSRVYGLTISSDGTRLAVASLNRADTLNRKLAPAIIDARLPVTGPGGTIIIRVWDTASSLAAQKPVNTLSRDLGEVLAITFSPDLKQLATVGQDGIVREDSLDIQGFFVSSLRLAAGIPPLTPAQCVLYRIHTNRCEAVELDNEGSALARGGKLWRAAAKFKKASKLDSSIRYNPDPRTAAKRIFARSLRDDAAKLARDGNLEEATKKYEEAKSLDPTFKIDPQNYPKQLLAQKRVDEGRAIALDERLDNNLRKATEKFQEAKTLDPGLKIDPQNYSKQLLAQKRVAEGRKLARDGNLADATKKFQEALSLNPSLSLDPEQEARNIVLESRVSKALELAEQGKIKESLSAFLEVQKQNPTKIAGEDWNALCWNGSLWGHPRLVVNDACDKAVKLSQGETVTNSRDSRGLARALTSDTKGAIEDFQYYVEHTDDSDKKSQRQRWIAALRQGSNPFTPEVLKTLFSQ